MADVPVFPIERKKVTLPDGTVATVPLKKHRRSGPKPGSNPRHKVVPGDRLSVAQMSGVGLSRGKIAQVLKMSVVTVDQILAQPDIKEFTRQLREATRPITLATLHQAALGMHEWVGDLVDKKDADGLESVSKSMLAMERVAASVSGENKPAGVQVAVINQTESSDEAKALIRALMGGQA